MFKKTRRAITLTVAALIVAVAAVKILAPAPKHVDVVTAVVKYGDTAWSIWESPTGEPQAQPLWVPMQKRR